MYSIFFFLFYFHCTFAKSKRGTSATYLGPIVTSIALLPPELNGLSLKSERSIFLLLQLGLPLVAQTFLVILGLGKSEDFPKEKSNKEQAALSLLGGARKKEVLHCGRMDGLF